MRARVAEVALVAPGRQPRVNVCVALKFDDPYKHEFCYGLSKSRMWGGQGSLPRRRYLPGFLGDCGCRIPHGRLCALKASVLTVCDSMDLPEHFYNMVAK